MVIVESYSIAVLMCFITMLCWGSWANTQKLATREWRFQLFYWDYAIGVLVFALILAFTMGSWGTLGQSFLENLQQASRGAFFSAFLGGVIFNLSNILLVAAIDIAGMAVAFPIGVGLALVIGVITNYLATPVGNPLLLFLGVFCVIGAILVDAVAYRKLQGQNNNTTIKGIVISVLAGVLMGFFYRFVAASMSENFITPELGKFTPYSAVVIFSLGLFLSNFIWNSFVMVKPFFGQPVPFHDYFKKGDLRLHSIGVLGGVIWSLGMSFSIIASGAAGFAISYGLGQGATMIAALWGVFVWKEFKNAPKKTGTLLALMFIGYIIGLTLIIVARLV